MPNQTLIQKTQTTTLGDTDLMYVLRDPLGSPADNKISFFDLKMLLTPSSIVYVPTTGNTIVLTNTGVGIINVILNPAGTLATLTITFPTTGLYDGQTIKINSTRVITALTMNGGTINGPATALALNTPLAWVYNTVTSTWYRTT